MSRSSFLKILLLAFILRALFFGFLVEKFGPENGLFFVDASQYATLAVNLSNGNGFSLNETPPFLPDVYRTPGYPLFLAAFYKLFGTFWPANVFQVIINSFVPVMVMWLTWKMSADSRASYAAGILTAIEPHLIMHQISIATEGIFIFLLTFFAVLTVKYFNRPSIALAALTGLLFALASITRPYFLYFFPFIIFFLWWGAKNTFQWKKIILVCACFLLPSIAIIFPWMLRNKNLTEHFVLSTSGWYNIYTRLSTTVYATANHQSFQSAFNRSIQQLRDDGFIEKGEDAELYNPNLTPILKERSLAILKKYPKETLLLQPISLLAIFTHDNLLNMLAERGLISPPKWPPTPLSLTIMQKNPLKAIKETLPYIHGSYSLPYIMRMVWGFLLFCSFVGARKLFYQNPLDKKSVIFVGVLVLFFAIMTLPIAAAIDARMRMVFEPIYFIFVAVGLTAIFQKPCLFICRHL